MPPFCFLTNYITFICFVQRSAYHSYICFVFNSSYICNVYRIEHASTHQSGFIQCISTSPFVINLFFIFSLISLTLFFNNVDNAAFISIFIYISYKTTADPKIHFNYIKEMHLQVLFIVKTNTIKRPQNLHRIV